MFVIDVFCPFDITTAINEACCVLKAAWVTETGSRTQSRKTYSVLFFNPKTKIIKPLCVLITLGLKVFNKIFDCRCTHAADTWLWWSLNQRQRVCIGANTKSCTRVFNKSSTHVFVWCLIAFVECGNDGVWLIVCAVINFCWFIYFVGEDYYRQPKVMQCKSHEDLIRILRINARVKHLQSTCH